MSENKAEDKKLKFILRHTSIKRKKVCPICLGNLEMAPPFWGWLIPQEYRCKACSYQGPVYVEHAEQEDA